MCVSGDRRLTWNRLLKPPINSLRPEWSTEAIIGSDNGVSPVQHQAIIWTNAVLLSFGLKLQIVFKPFHSIKMHLKMSFAKRRPFCHGLNVLMKPPLNEVALWLTIFSHAWDSRPTSKETGTSVSEIHWPIHCQTSHTNRTKSQNLNVSRLVLQLSLPNPLKPGVKSRMKM